MPRNKTPTYSKRILRLLADVRQPLYLVAPDGQIEFANQALGEWLGIDASQLIGQRCIYGEPVSPAELDRMVALLAPPPEAAAGIPCEAPWPAGASQPTTSRSIVRFFPLIVGDHDALVLGVVEVEPRPAAIPPNEARHLHAALQSARATGTLAARLVALVGLSPQSRRAREQWELARQTNANVQIVAPLGAQAAVLARELHAARIPASRVVALDAPRADAETIEELLSPWPAAGDRASNPEFTLLAFEIDQLEPAAQLALEQRLRAAGNQVRVISTVARSLASLAADSAFRLELACLLSPQAIEIVPLAERRDDIPLIIQALVEEQNKPGARQLGGLQTEAMDRLLEHAWPGDLDELAAVIRAACAQSKGPLATVADLPSRVYGALQSAAGATRRTPSLDLEAYLAEIETELLHRALALAKGNKTKAAHMLGMTRPRLYRRLVQCGLEQPPTQSAAGEIDFEEIVEEEDRGESEA